MDILIMGEVLVEIMRPTEGVSFKEEGLFRGPFPSGAPAICIDAAARVGSKTMIIGGVGADDFGKCITDRLEKHGVDCSRVIESKERATGVAFITYYVDGSREFIFHMGNTPAVEAKAPEAIEDVKYMHIMGCSLMSNKEFAQEILKTMRMLVARGTKISFDPNIRTELFTDESIHEVIREVMDNTSVFLPGVEELLATTGKDNVKEAIAACFENPRMEVIALKQGSKGSIIYTRDGSVEIGAYKVEQVDATGAGDCFDGVFVSALIQGKDLETAGKMAAAAGALNAAAFGPMEGDISPETIKEMIEK